MLTVTRKNQQGVRIGPDIVIRVLQVKGRSVRLGIEAPNELLILRDELVPHHKQDPINPRDPDAQAEPAST